MTGRRAIGPIGTLARVLAGVGVFVLAFLIDGDEISWRDALLGLGGFPAVLLLAQLVRLRFSQAPLQATGPVGFAVNAVVLVVLLFFSLTRPATLLWLSVSLLLAAWRGYAGCETLAISNWLLRRHDQVGCIPFAPLDAIEAKAASRKTITPAQ